MNIDDITVKLPKRTSNFLFTRFWMGTCISERAYSSPIVIRVSIQSSVVYLTFNERCLWRWPCSVMVECWVV